MSQCVTNSRQLSACSQFGKAEVEQRTAVDGVGRKKVFSLIKGPKICLKQH